MRTHHLDQTSIQKIQRIFRSQLKQSRRPKKVDRSDKLKKVVQTISSTDFGHKGNQCYRATLITIDGEYYFGFIRCWLNKNKYAHSRCRLLMPLSVWHSFSTQVQRNIQFPSITEEEAADAQRYLFLVTSL